MYKQIIIATLITVGIIGVASAAPSLIYQKTILPETDSTYELGTSTNAWLRINSDEVCLTGDSCITTWSGTGAWTFTSTTLDYWFATTAGIDTDGLGEGSTNLWYTDTRVADYINASTTMPVGDWNTAFGWGNHASGGYYAAASFTTDWNSNYNATSTLNGFTNNQANWNTAYGWGDWNTNIDISTDTNLTVGAVGIELALDDIALTTGYIIPKSASTTNWNTFYDTPSNRITAGTNLAWTSNTLDATDTTYLGGTNLTLDGTTFNVDDAFLVNSAADTTAFGITMGSATTTDTLYVGGDLTVMGDTNLIDVYQTSITTTGNSTTTGYMSAGTDDGNFNFTAGDINASGDLYVGGTSLFTGAITGNISTATALAADGGDCSAGSYPLGVDASGAVQSCTDATTEIDSAIGTHLLVVADTNTIGHLNDTDWDTFNNKQATITDGTNLTFAGATLNVDDAFLVNSAADTTSFGITMGSATTTDTFRAEGKATFSGNVGIGTTGPLSKLTVDMANQTLTTDNTAVSLVHAGFYSTDAYAIDKGAAIGVGGNYSANAAQHTVFAAISGRKANATVNNADGYLSLWTYNSGLKERLRIDENGNVGIGTTAPNGKLHVHATDSDTPGTGSISIGDISGGVPFWDFRVMAGGANNLILDGANGGVSAAIMSWDRVSGNVGIGVTTPLALLHVNGTSKFGGIINTDNNWISGDGGAEGISIADNGSVGIGTTGPNARLSLGTVTQSKLLVYDGGLTGAGGNGIFAGFGIDMPANSFSMIAHNGGFLNFGKYTNANDVSAMTEFMRIDNNGNVGIGTTVTGHKLNFGGATGNSTIHLGYNSTAAATSVGRITSNSYNVNNPLYSLAEMEFMTADTGYYGQIQFRTNNVNSTNTRAPVRMVIDKSGNVGIGTTAPAAQLHVEGTNQPFLTTYADDSVNLVLQTSTNFAADIGPSLVFRGEITAVPGISGFATISGRKETGVSGNTAGYLQMGTFRPNIGMVEHMRITSSGEIKITQPTQGNPIIADTIIGTLQFHGDDDTASADEVSGQIQSISTGTWTDGAEDAKMVLNSVNNGVLNANQLVLDSSGNVGIGTTAPGEKLNVVSGDIEIGAGYDFQWGSSDNRMNYNGTSVRIFQGTVESVNVDGGQVTFPNGNVGIGTTSPSQVLSVAGNVLADAYLEYSPFYAGDALEALAGISCIQGSEDDNWCDIDHSTLPDGLELEPSLISIGHLVSMNTKAIQELSERDIGDVDIGKAVEDYFNKMTFWQRIKWIFGF